MRVWDVRRAIAAMKSIDPSRELRIAGSGEMGVVGLYAALFEPAIPEIYLQNPSTSHANGPQLLNVLKIMDVPAAAAMAAEKRKVTIVSGNPGEWKYPNDVAKAMHWQRFEVIPPK
jgi:hypothetical protein